MGGGGGGGAVLMVIQCRDRARRVFTGQAGVSCAKREAKLEVFGEALEG